MYDLGRALTATMKQEDKRTVTIDVLTDTLEGGKKFSFVTGNIWRLYFRNEAVRQDN